jgi:flagellar M-ring protein FliF
VAGIAAAVLVALVLALFLALRTNWQPAFTGVDPATAGQIESVLAEVNIPSRTDTATGVVYVPAHQFDQAVTTVHMSPVLWDPAYTFTQAMADMGMGTTNTQQHEALLRVREGEVANMLMRTNFINSATVGLDLPNVPSFLIQATRPATATVNVAGSRTLTSEDGEVIALMVSRMVAGLYPENVAVIDDNLNILFSDGLPGHGGADMAGGMSLSMSFEFHVRQVLNNAIMETFSPMFDDVNPAFALDFDWSIVNSVAREYTSPLGEDNPDGLRDEHEIIHRVGETADGAPMGIPGLDGQGGMPGGDLFPGTGGPGTMFIEEREERVTHFQNFVETVRAWGHIPGRFFAPTSSVAITLTNHYVFYEEIERELGTLDELSWLEWQADVGNGGIIIDPDFIEQFENHVAMATGIPSVSIIIQYRNHFIDEEVTPLPIAEIILLSLVLIFVALLAFLMIRRTSPDIIEEIEPELSVEDMLVSSRLESERAAEIERLAEIQYNADSQVKEQIDKFAVEMPESVAQLLRNWINEDWE